MASRPTSLAAYHALVKNGGLPRRRAEVYEALYKYGPASASELANKLPRLSIGAHQNIHVRLGELRDQGVVQEVHDNHIDKMTGRRVILWEVTQNAVASAFTPKRRQGKSKRAKLEDLAERAIAELEMSTDRHASDASVDLRAELEELQSK